MMVSKVAVMALVAVIAVPILLGYALNLSETTVTEYKPDGDSVDVTPLLQTGTAYTTANADVYKLNSDFTYNGVVDYYPVYNEINTTKSSLQLSQEKRTLSNGAGTNWRLYNADVEIYIFVGKDSGVTFNRLEAGTHAVLTTQNNISSIHYYAADNTVEVAWQYGSGGGVYYYTPANTNEYLVFTNNSGSDVTLYATLKSTTGTSYVDFSSGFYTSKGATVNIPDETKSLLMTVDLDSITDSSYSVRYGIGQAYFLLEKTTTAGVVSWKATQQETNQNGQYVDVNETDLYYNPSNNNVYQIYVSATPQGTTVRHGDTFYIVNWHTELRYVGSWPTLIGTANYYIKYDYDHLRESWNSNSNTFKSVGISILSGSRSPSTRLDSAQFSAFAYGIIIDTSYAPADFKTNPATTLNVSKAGLSLEFGGNTYTVDKSGNITLGTHKVSVNGLKLESVPTAGGYANKINGTTISVTADPSTIKFNGNWGASVSTVANASSTHTHTEWTAGEFGWDGIDHNFLMVGLLTSIGVFIALGIYIRRTKAALWPLLIVCGGAAMLFFVML